MNNLGTLKSLIEVKTGKDWFGGVFTPDNYTMLSDWAQLEHMNACIRLFEVSGVLSDDTRPFIRTYGDDEYPVLEVTQIGSTDMGYVVIPDDYWYRARAGRNQYLQASACATATGIYRSLEFVRQSDWDYMRSTKLMYPTQEEPIAAFQNEKIVICPFFRYMTLTYIRRPLAPYFDYDIVSGEVIYLPPGEVHVNSSVEPSGSPSLSVEYEWPESVYNVLAEILVKYYALMYRGEFNLKALEINKPV